MRQASFWDWLGPFILMAAFIAYLFLTSANEIVMCRQDDDNCFREWVSALSGWFAGAAAVVTILFLVRQINSADKNHLDIVELELEPKFACARRAAYHAAFGKSNWQDLIEFFSEDGSGSKGGTLDYPKEFQKLREFIMDPAFDEFERIVGTPEPYSLTTIRVLIDLRLDSYKPGQAEFISASEFTFLRAAAKQTIHYCDMCIWRARNYTTRWEMILGREVNPMREDGYPV
ncbi:hypothetical protein [Ensifer aridi]|uniref:hypothetical protein n=1 Tax=Ensifer aridi TaxID=1708715 RepID=UPI000A0FD326|nr:hypothetical protein [Ensifer aridi]